MTTRKKQPEPEVIDHGPAPAVIRCIEPVFVESYPFKRGHSHQISFRDVFTGERAAWLWAAHGPKHFEPYGR